MISFIIVTFNSVNKIRSCIKHIESIEDLPYEIIIIDNRSRDGTRKVVEVEYPDIKLFASKKNYGFSWGVNKGVSLSRGDVLFLINPDAWILTKKVKKIYDYILGGKIAVVGPKVFNPNRTRQYSARRFPTLETGIFNKSSIFTTVFPKNKFSMEYLNPIKNDDKRQIVDWVSGCAMMIRRDVFEELEGFDENYFLFYEDIDFCYRANKSGYTIQYHPDIEVVHEIGISVTVPTFKVNYERHHGMWIYYRKNFLRTKVLDILVFLGITARFFITSFKVLLRRISLR